MVDLLNADLTTLTSYPSQYLGKLDAYRNRLRSYSFSIILVTDAPIDVATDIFTRINVRGKQLSVFEIMVAKTFDKERDFDLAERHDQLIQELDEIDYGTIPPAVVLQAVSAILAGDVRKKTILNLDRKSFIDVWPKVVDALETAAEYFRNHYRIPVSNLLPYPALLIPFTHYFYHHPDRPPAQERDYLQDFFWRVVLTSRYSGPTETNIAQDIRRVEDILKGKRPSYDHGVDISPEFVRNNGYFNAGRSFIKAVLCVLAYQEPKSFVDNSIVRVSNDWLKQANSRNYHHFFPKAFLAKQETHSYWLINHIANITIVDDFLNKRQIRDKAPSTYMAAFKAKNKQLGATMMTHLIDLDEGGVWDDDYDRFLAMRCQLISEELKRRILPIDLDRAGTVSLPDDDDSESLAAAGGDVEESSN